MNELNSWGVLWNESVPYASDWCCQHCGWECLVGKFDWYKFIVGFDAGTWTPPKIVIECPECFEKFWFHCGGLIDSLERFCPNWPGKAAHT